MGSVCPIRWGVNKFVGGIGWLTYRIGMTNEVGRPVVQLSDLAENWRDIMHAIYGDGGSDAEVKVALAISPARAMSNDLWDALQAREPEFSEAVKEGRQLSEAWWANAGKRGIFMGKDFNATTYVFSMKNRFHNWKDKQDVKLSGDEDAPVEFTVKIDNS